MKPKSPLVGILALLLLVGLGATFFFQAKSKFDGRLRSLDGRLSLTLPPDWTEMDSLNPIAVLKAGNEEADAYVVVVSEKKSEVQGCEEGLQPYSDFVRGRLRDSLRDRSERGPWWISVGAHRGLRYEVLGTSQDGYKLVYLHTVIETPEYFHQAVGWTQAALYPKNRAALRQVADSLREDGR